MYITNKRKKIGIFITEYGFIAVFKEVAGPSMAAIKVLGIPSKKLSHDGGDALSPASKEQMNVVVHKNPCINSAAAIYNALAQALNEAVLVLVVIEDS